MSRAVIGITAGLAAVIVLGGIIMAVNRDEPALNTTDNTSSQATTPETNATNQTTPEPSPPASEKAEVTIENSSYQPSTVRIKKGGTVTWTNKEALEHDISPDSPSADFKKSELLGKGESFVVTFATAGTYTYHCTSHPFMKGTVQVVE